MSGRKSFRAPFWALLLLTVLIAIYYFLTIYFYTNNKYIPKDLIQSFLWQFSIIVLALCIECFVYWKLQKQIIIKWWAWSHVILVYFALTLSPILFMISIPLIKLYSAQADNRNFIRQLATFRMIFFWSCLIIAHVFFIATLIKSYSSKIVTDNPANESSDLLDEFAS